MTRALSQPAARRPLRRLSSGVAAISLALALSGCLGLEGRESVQAAVPSQPTASMGEFVAGLWPDARARGVSRATFDAAFAGVTVDPSIIAITKRQSEFVQPIWTYVDNAAAESRVAAGRQAATQWSAVLGRIEERYGVPRSVVLGIWGMETNFGANTGDKSVIRSLATLAQARYRGDFFRNELLTALQILEQDHIEVARMRGSWAGAMGQTQFMPSSFMKHAVDFTGDGVRDIWGSVPDALASTANYLKSFGWQPGLPWGMEVALPANFSYLPVSRTFAAWQQAGVKRADGRPLPTSGEARLFFPAGHLGPAFLLTANFDVIKAYNSSDAYALGVGHLGDRIVGGGPFQRPWPRNQTLLAKPEVKELQEWLARRGHDVGEADGRIGSKTREATRTEQARLGLTPDGFPTPALLQRLRAGR